MKRIAAWYASNPFARVATLLAVVVLLIGAALVYWSRTPVEALIRQEAIDDAVGAAMPKVLRFVAPSEMTGLVSGERRKELDEFINTSVVVGSHVVRIKLWSTEGQVVYSTRPEQIGESFPDNEEFLEALAGETVSEVSSKPESAGEHGLGILQEVYTPLVWDKAKGPEGVLEIYSYYGHHLELLRRIQETTLGILAVMSTIFVVGGIVVFRSGSRHIRDQRDIAAANARRLEALIDTTSVLNSGGDFPKRAQAALDRLVEVVDADGAVLRVIDAEANELRSVARSGPEPSEDALLSTIRRGQGIAGLAWEQGKPVVAQDYAAHPLALAGVKAMGVKSIAALPIACDGRTIGVIAINSMRRNHFTPERLALLEAIGKELGGQIENARLRADIEEEMERSRIRLDTFRSAVRGIRLQEEPDMILRVAVETACALTGAQKGGLMMFDAEGEMRHWALSEAMDGEGERLRHGIQEKLKAGNGLFATTANSLGAFIQETLDPKPGNSSGYVVLVPLQNSDGMRGALFVADKAEGREFSRDDERLLALYAVAVQLQTDNMALYASVAREKRRLTNIQESMSEGLVVVKSDNITDYLNPAAEALVEVEAPKVIGRPLDEWLAASIDIEQWEQLLPVIQARMKEPGLRPEAIEVSLEKPAHKDLEVTPFHIPAEADTVMAGLLMRNVTLERDLERRRDAFISMASHELRTPMVSVMGFTELLLVRDPGPEVRRQWLEQVLRESKRLTAIADDLLSVSRIQQGRVDINLSPVSLAKELDGVLANIKPTTTKHAFDVQIADGVSYVKADSDKVVNVLYNLVTNAVKYSPKGGKVTIKAALEDSGDRVVLSIADEGIGIAANDMHNLYTTFSRIDRPETVGIRGTGLGLYIVKQMLELMDGRIWVESEINKGSTFYISLPAYKNGKNGAGVQSS
ncbi:MAG: GAF domain-containing protein [Chloroflexi bacterium]|nr:GAF domain-containing protein [Chloroflexota bacterium]